MNRREFLKLGLATLAAAWLVAASKESVVADVSEEEVVSEIKTESEWPINCESCNLYMCGSHCPRWWNRPYFVPTVNSDYRKHLPPPQGKYFDNKKAYDHHSTKYCEQFSPFRIGPPRREWLIKTE